MKQNEQLAWIDHEIAKAEISIREARIRRDTLQDVRRSVLLSVAAEQMTFVAQGDTCNEPPRHERA